MLGGVYRLNWKICFNTRFLTFLDAGSGRWDYICRTGFIFVWGFFFLCK
jgi:hypothetical protein